MPRRSGVPKREIIADPIYNSKVVTKLINQVMQDGKRGTAQRICYDAFEIIKEKTGKDAIEVFDQAMENIMPVLEVKAARHIRSRLRFVRSGARRWRSAGWCSSLRSAAKEPCGNVFPARSWTRRITRVPA